PPTNVEENRPLGGLGGSDSGVEAPTAENIPRDWFASGETAESTRTPFDHDYEPPPRPPPAPAAPPQPAPPLPFRQPDLFADRKEDPHCFSKLEGVGNGS